jgi:hypothetical protein
MILSLFEYNLPTPDSSSSFISNTSKLQTEIEISYEDRLNEVLNNDLILFGKRFKNNLLVFVFRVFLELFLEQIETLNSFMKKNYFLK